MVRSILELNEALRTAEQEIRKLKLDMQKVSGGGTRSTNFTGVLQPENGGTGVTCDIKGAVTIWANDSGGVRTAGDVVIENGDRTFTTTTSVGNRLVIGIVEDASVANGVNGCIRHTGYQAGVKVQGAVTAGDYLRTSATAGRAESAGTTPVDGAFAIALTANGGGAGTVNAFLLAGAVHQTASAGVTDHDALTGLNESEDHFAKGADLTIAAGVITATHSHHRVDTEAAAASDDLDTVSGFVANRLLLLQPVSDARTIVIKHNTGNILCVNNADLTLDDAHDFAILLYDSSLSKWMALFDSGGSAGTYMKRVLIQEHEFHPISAISDQIGATPNQQGTYLFASAAARAVIFNWLVPADWDSGAVDFVLHYAKDAIGTGNIVHRFNTSLLDVGDDLGQTGTDSDQTVAVTADPAQTHQTITWADLFTPGAVGEVWRINYQRRGADAGDTYGGQSHVFCIEIQYTAKRIPS